MPQQLVGPWNFYYLGGWNDPPIAGETNPATGQVVPNPIAVGSFYYDIDTQTLMVWNGTQWVASVALTSGYEARFVYVAAEGQQMFTGPDVNGATPAVNGSPSTIHINGVALIGEQHRHYAGLHHRHGHQHARAVCRCARRHGGDVGSPGVAR